MTKRIQLVGLFALIAMLAPIAVFAAGSSEARSSGPIELRWASICVGQDSKAVTVAKLVEEFNAANAGRIRVTIDPQPDYNAYEQKIRTTLAANQVPADIWTIKLNPTTAQFYASPLLMDFSKVFTGAWKDSFDAGNVA